MATILRSAREYYRRSLLLTREAVEDARTAREQSPDELAATVITHQARSAVLADTSVRRMLLEQDIEARADALLNSVAFTTETERLLAMIEQTETDYEFDRLVSTLVADAGNSAAGVAVASRPKLVWVRHVSPPCCKRCAVLAGRHYRWSEGFERHPNCRCVHVPTTLSAASGLTQDPDELVAQGLVSDLTGAEVEALMLGADLGKIVNVRRSQAGLTTSGRVLSRRDRLTPEGVFAQAGDDQDRAIELLVDNGYLKAPSTAAAPGGGGPRPPAPPAPPTPAAPEPDPIDWAARQAALGIETNGETLEPAEIEFAERFLALGERIEWIATGSNGRNEREEIRSTNDFIWRSNGDLQVELKSPHKAAYKPIKSAVAAAVREARENHQIVKDHFLIDLGQKTLTETLIRQLSLYNVRNRASGNEITALWVLSRGALTQIELQ